MTPFDLRYRQVHLDFHTTEHITQIAGKFDPEQFADTLVKAHVNSVTCMARCHHGWMYFDTRRFPERRHPHLTRNLLQEQIEACHQRGIRVPIYTTIQWDHLTANEHPEWLAIDASGRIVGYSPSPFEPGFYRFLCVNSPYLDFLKAHVQELLETFSVDGLFFDIVEPIIDASVWTRAEMESRGLDPADETARKMYGRQIIADFQRDMTAFVRNINSDCSIFFNSGHIGTRHRSLVDTFTHFEIESLPSGLWGYTHFPLSACYSRNLGRPIVGMTGKFHTAWGDFHSFKNPAALQYECFRMLALNAACSVGDQLHPDGEMSQATYDLIGSVYAEVESKEPYCIGAKPVVEIALLTPEEFTLEKLPPAAIGAMQMLQEAGHQFDVIDSQSDLERYRLVILPDNIPAAPDFAARLDAYIAGGGSIIASYESGLDPAAHNFMQGLGIRLKGPAPYSPDFIVPTGEIGLGLPETEHVMYLQGLEVEALPGTTILAPAIVPYFNRTYRHFSSHLHTPSSGQAAYPAIVQRGRVIYFAHPIFTQYHRRAPRWCKQLVLNAIRQLLPVPLVQHNGPSTLMVTLNEQAQERRRVLHVLHYIPTRRSQEIDIIEDVIPLYELAFTIREDRPVQSVVCVPQQVELPFERQDRMLRFVLPRLHGHQIIVLNERAT